MDLSRLVLTTTPRAISDEILAFCGEVVPKSDPFYLSVEADDEDLPRECSQNVARRIQASGGDALVGWVIWECPHVLIEAEFHAVWSDAEGGLHDVTPREQGERRILFLPDAGHADPGKAIDNVRKPLVDHPAVHLLIQKSRAGFELRQSSPSRVVSMSIDQFQSIQLSGEELAAFAQVAIAQRRRDDGCVCGSGKKFRYCCWKRYR